jgi:hypothetical protein
MFTVESLALPQTMDQFAAGGTEILKQYWGQTDPGSQTQFAARMNAFLAGYCPGIAANLLDPACVAKNPVAVEVFIGPELNVQFARRVQFGTIKYYGRRPDGPLVDVHYRSESQRYHSSKDYLELADDATLVARHTFGPELLQDEQVAVEMLIITYWQLARLLQFGWSFQHGHYLPNPADRPTKAHTIACGLKDLLSQKHWMRKPRTDAEFQAWFDAQFATLSD